MRLDFSEVEWLGDDRRPPADLLLPLVGGRGAHDERKVLESRVVTDLASEVSAASVGQVVVDDHHRRRLGVQRIQQWGEGREPARPEPDLLGHLGEELQGGHVVIDDVEHGRLGPLGLPALVPVRFECHVVEAHAMVPWRAGCNRHAVLSERVSVYSPSVCRRAPLPNASRS
jgi:hypothetical protein